MTEGTEINRIGIDALLVSPDIRSELIEIVQSLSSSVYSIEHFEASLSRAHEIVYIADGRSSIRAFAVYELITVGSTQPITVIYRSSSFVRLSFRKTGLGTAITRALLSDLRPDIFSFTTRLNYWLKSTQKVLMMNGYTCFPQTGRLPPKSVYEMAREILRKTNRDDSTITESLVRLGVYTEAAAESKMQQQVVRVADYLAPGDAVMVLAFGSRGPRIV